MFCELLCVCLLLGSAQDPVHAKGWVLHTEGYAQLLFCEQNNTEHTMTLLLLLVLRPTVFQV